ncbi:hypothetical protein TgHK011_002891 [Trichoderma gracile]|nr:hypothetical protein TgHK011_002891 [Trichoderma gracile]
MEKLSDRVRISAKPRRVKRKQTAQIRCNGFRDLKQHVKKVEEETGGKVEERQPPLHLDTVETAWKGNCETGS